MQIKGHLKILFCWKVSIRENSLKIINFVACRANFVVYILFVRLPLYSSTPLIKGFFELSSTRIGFSQSICIIFTKGKTKDCLIPLFLTPGALKQTIQISYICQFFFNQGCYKIESLHEHFQTICSQNLTPDDCLAFLVDISITNIDSWQHFKTWLSYSNNSVV